LVIAPLRRRLLIAPVLAPLGARARAAIVFPKVTPQPLVFPRDHGAHPDYRIEWWYLTGVLGSGDDPVALGLQVTFFRVHTGIDPANPSRFAAHQLLFAHVALADPATGRLAVDQQIVRLAAGAARAAPGDTDVALGRWRLARNAAGAFECDAPARNYRLRFVATPTQPVLPQGQDGFFPKQTQSEFASFYYSVPQLTLQAEVQREQRRDTLHGVAWLDHEWASTLLEPQATGWDWIGMNLDDGTAVMAFQTRRKGDGAVLFNYASVRAAGSSTARQFHGDAVHFEPLAFWESPRTRARYPVSQRIRIGDHVFETRPLLNDQELDARVTGSAIYWEGASALFENGRPVGRGYLEMTGYAAPLTL
jgi:predicted secreted hydrolase